MADRQGDTPEKVEEEIEELRTHISLEEGESMLRYMWHKEGLSDDEIEAKIAHYEANPERVQHPTEEEWEETKRYLYAQAEQTKAEMRAARGASKGSGGRQEKA